MTKRHRHDLVALAVFALIGQLVFWPLSGKYSESRYEGRIFATTGIKFDSADLHKLNEGAHYFGQTMIGWSKFPNFRNDLVKSAGLPEDSTINLRMQERQNVVLTLTSRESIAPEQLNLAKDFLQIKLDEYNKNTNTKFILTNLDYDISKVQRSILVGAAFALILSLALGAAFLFMKKELFPPRLKL